MTQPQQDASLPQSAQQQMGAQECAHQVEAGQPCAERQPYGSPPQVAVPTSSCFCSPAYRLTVDTGLMLTLWLMACLAALLRRRRTRA